MRRLFSRAAMVLLTMLLTTAMAWATTTSTINVGDTDYTLFMGFTATDGTAVNNAFVYGNAVDGSTSTSWHPQSSDTFVEFNTDDPIVPKGYIFNTYMEGYFYPHAWVLKAKANTTDDWTTLSSYSGQSLSSGQEFQYACSNDGNTAYKYFRFEASSTNNNIWLTEIRLYGFENLTYTHLTVTPATCTATGIKVDCYRRSDGKYFTDETGTTELAESDVIDQIKPHTGEHHEATDVNIEYWQCSMCSKYFSNVDCTTEITEEETKIYRTITIDGSISELVTSNVNQALAGATVTLTVSHLIDASTLKVNNGAVELTDNGSNQYTFTVPADNVTVTAETLSTYSFSLPDNMEIVSASNEADGNGKYISGTVITFAPSLRYLASNVSDGTNTLEPDANGVYTVTIDNANINITATVVGSSTLYLARATSDFTAADGETLVGSTNHTVTIADGASITLNNATISGGIVCEGTATITLDGTNIVNVNDAFLAYSKAGIQIGSSGTTLTIRGSGSLTATGGSAAAGIGLGRTWDENVTAGTIVIEGGTVNASGDIGIGIGTVGNSQTATIDGISIKGGTVSASLGKGNIYNGSTATVGYIKIYDTIDMVDASKITETVTYMHMDGESATDVTANKTDYFTIGENGDRRIIVPKDDTDYTITIADGIEHGTITGATTAKYMETVTINATPDFGFRLVRLVVKDADDNDVASTGNTFLMPKSNVMVSAVFEQGNHGTTEFKWFYSTGPEPTDEVRETIYDGVTTVNLQQIGQSYNILKYEGYTSYQFRLDNNTYEANIPYAGGTGEFYEAGNATNFSLNYDGETGYYDITMTDAGNGKWSVSILPTAGQMDVVPDQTYTGSAITPEPLVIAGSLSLTKGEDYEYSYTNNTNVGTATVRATFQGTYASLGYVEKTFNIVPSTIMVNVTGGGTVTIGDKSVSDGEAFGVMSEKGASVVLTLAPESGNAVRSVEYGYTNSKGTNRSGVKLPISDGTATLTVPNDLKDGTGVTLTVTFAAALVGGADEAGAVALTDAAVTDLAGGWYKVTDDITFDHTLNLLGNTHLTIASGKTMTVSAATTRGIDSDYTLNVGGAGALSVTASGSYPVAVRVGNYVQTGATVTASGFIGIRCYNSFDDSTNDFTFSGGQLTVTGTSDGIWADNTITISCTNGSDFIQSSSYDVLSGGTIKVADGKALTDGTNIYTGTLTDEQISAIATKTLTKSSWTELKMALEAGQSVTLTNNVARVNSDCIDASGTVTLDLNGYTIDGGTSQTNPLFSVNNGVSLTITDSRTGGNLCNSGANATVSVNGGTLTLAAGTINAQSGGVIIWEGNFNMTGGTITGGTVSGVGLSSNGSFTMTGGSITGNDVGVDVNSATAMFIISGNVSIVDNTTKDVSLNYDYESSNFNPIHIGGALNEAARIGINISDAAANAITGNVVMVFTDGLKGKGSKQNFTLNGRDGHTLVTDGPGEVGIAVPYSLTVPDGVTVSGFSIVSERTYEVGCGEVVTLLYGGEVNSGYSVRYTVPNGAFTYLGSVDAQGKTAKFTMPGANTTITKADDAHYTFGGITLRETFAYGESVGLDATFDGSSEVPVSIPNDIEVKSVTYDRKFTAGKPATVMLPFSLSEGQTITGGTLYKFSGVGKQGDKWMATMTETTTLQANTPYLLMPDDGLTDNELTFSLNDGTVTLNTTTAGGDGLGTSAPSDWEFMGTFTERHWYDGMDGIHPAENDTEIGSVYGFAATSGKATDGVTDVAAGDFVKFAAGAWLRPMRCYLKYTGSGNPWGAGARSIEAVELPSSISVILVSADGETTSLSEKVIVNSEKLANAQWYTLDGKKLQGKPMKKGVYIVNGKKQVIK